MMQIFFYANKNFTLLEAPVNNQLIEIQKWLCVNKLSLNIDKSNFLIFHPPQKKLPFHIELSISNKTIKQENNLKYLGGLIDKHSNWKAHVR